MDKNSITDSKRTSPSKLDVKEKQDFMGIQSEREAFVSLDTKHEIHALLFLLKAALTRFLFAYVYANNS